MPGIISDHKLEQLGSKVRMTVIDYLDSLPLFHHVMMHSLEALLRVPAKAILGVHFPEEVQKVVLYYVHLGSDSHVVQGLVNLTKLLYIVLLTFLQLLAKT